MSSNLAYHGSDGDYFAEHADTGTWNPYVDRPAMLELIGDVPGQRILDAGCGAGHYAAALVERGASVLGIDGSTVPVTHAQARLGARAVVQHDLDTPLDLLADATFDGVVCALVLHHLRARPPFPPVSCSASFDQAAGSLCPPPTQPSTGDTLETPTSRGSGWS